MANEDRKPKRSLQQQLADLSAAGLRGGQMTPEMEALAVQIIQDSRVPEPGDSIEFVESGQNGVRKTILIVAKFEHGDWIDVITDSTGKEWELNPAMDSYDILEHDDQRHPLYKASHG